MIPSRWRVWLARIWWGDAAEASLGRRGERAAAAFLKKQRYKLMRRNVRVRSGEADLLMLSPDRAMLVLVEVKTRLVDPQRAQPAPEASITAHKRRKLIQVADELSRMKRYEGKPVRIDVVAVEWPERGAPVIRHYPGAAMG